MKSLAKFSEEYVSGVISKKEYSEKMYNEGHSLLFEYSDILSKNELLDNISISKDDVFFTLKNGIKLVAIANDYGIIPLAILNFGKYEEKLWNKTISILDKTPQTIFDIGGNIGYFSLYLTKCFPMANIHCFEPIPNTYKYLLKDIELNDADNIKTYNLGLSNFKQSVEMFYNHNGCGASSLRNLLPEDNVEKIVCEFTTLDEFVKEHKIDNIDFIKCDVEGAEKLVYEGGLKTIEKFKPVIYSEMLRKWSAKFNYHPNDIIKLLAELNYDCYAISEESYYKIDKITEETVETNYIFKQKS